MLHYFPLHCYQNNLSRRWSISSRFGAAFLADQRWFWKKLAASSVPTYPTPAVYQKVQPLFAPAWSTYMVSVPVPPGSSALFSSKATYLWRQRGVSHRSLDLFTFPTFALAHKSQNFLLLKGKTLAFPLKPVAIITSACSRGGSAELR